MADHSKRSPADGPDAVREEAYALLHEGQSLLYRGEDAAAVNVLRRLAGTFSCVQDQEVLWTVNQALLTVAAGAMATGRYREALASCQRVLRRIETVHQPAMAEREQRARALMRAAQALLKLKRFDELSRTSQVLFDEFGGDQDPAIRAQVVGGLDARALGLAEVEQSELALDTWDRLIERYRGDEAAEVGAAVARAMLNQALVMGQLGMHEGSVQRYKQLIRDFADDGSGALSSAAVREPETLIRDHVAWARVNLGDALRTAGEKEAALAAFCEAISSAADDAETQRTKPLFYARLWKAAVLDELGHAHDAIEAYDDVAGRFGDSTDPEVRERLDSAATRRRYLGERI